MLARKFSGKDFSFATGDDINNGDSSSAEGLVPVGLSMGDEG